MKTPLGCKMMNKQKGFNLIELLSTVVILGVVLALGVPSFRDASQNQRMGTQINELVSSINLARSEAVKRGSSITTCVRNAAGTACVASTSWLPGWLVFDDLDGDGVIDAGETIIRSHGAVTGVDSLVYPRTRITYDSRGFSGLNFAGTMVLCDSRGADEAKAFVVSPNGRIRLGVDSDGNGIVEDGGDVDVVCP